MPKKKTGLSLGYVHICMYSYVHIARRCLFPHDPNWQGRAEQGRASEIFEPSEPGGRKEILICWKGHLRRSEKSIEFKG